MGISSMTLQRYQFGRVLGW